MAFWMDEIRSATGIEIDNPDDEHGTDAPIYSGDYGAVATVLADGEYTASLIGDPLRVFTIIIENGDVRIK